MRKRILKKTLNFRFNHKSINRVFFIGTFILGLGLIPMAGMPLVAALDLADAPLLNKINPPAPNLMILMDDSASMGFEILVKGTFGGEFENPDDTTKEKGFCYVFDDMGDDYNWSKYSNAYRQMDSEDRKYWRTQWYEKNLIYYNPNIDYQPWPGYGSETYSDADKDEPLVHPKQTITLDLDGTALTVKYEADDENDDTLDIPWAHYYVKGSDNVIYLVAMEDGDISYYTFTTDSKPIPGDKIETATPIDVEDLPDGIEKEYDDARQNFANWFTYHRRREFIAKDALGHVITTIDDVRIGILGLNKHVVIPLKPVNAVIDGTLEDKTAELLADLYDYKSDNSTPLKHGLEDVGEYYKVNDGNLEGKAGTTIKGDIPYAAKNGACQLSFTVVVTDGYYTDWDHTSVGNADNNTAHTEWGGGQQPYKDAYSDTLADIAMHYYATDLSAYADLLPTSKWDKAAHQHMVTFAVAFGVEGNLILDDYERDSTSPDFMKKKSAGTYVDWPEVTGAQQPQSIDDLWHATVNGRGVFVSAGEPQKLNDGLTQIINDITDRLGSAASVAVNGDPMFARVNLDTVLFQGNYSNLDDEWRGDVKAYRVLNATTNKVDPSEKWSAADKLENPADSDYVAWDKRLIATFNGMSGVSGSGIDFSYDDLTEDQQNHLDDNADVVDFIKGKTGISGFRARQHILGDIVHSSPTYHNDVVYVGANDGMLHAFDADKGKEIFAYVPNHLFSNADGNGLIELTKEDYSHKYYVDLTPTVAKGVGIFNGTDAAAILVGGLGKGGRGYFALDITKAEPSAFPNTASQLVSMVKWEFPHGDESSSDPNIKNLGYSFSKSVVVQSYLLDTSGNPKWVVIFGNGYDSQNENALLYILDAANGNVIRTIDTKSVAGNGLSTPIAVDVNYDRKVDYVYAGDLKGNLWKFDLTADNEAQWKVAYGSSTVPKPLFQATDASNNPQPITTRPEVTYHPVEDGYMVFFGTGKYFENSDPEDTQVQTVYGIWDFGDDEDDNEYLGSLDRTTNKLSGPQLSSALGLLEQTEDSTIQTQLAGRTIRTLTNKEIEWDVQPDQNGVGNLDDPIKHVGWYFDLPISKERVVSDVTLRVNKLIVISFTPTDDDCKSGGTSMLMEIDWETGGRLAGVNLDVNDDGKIDKDDEAETEDEEDTKKVPPSGLEFVGMLQRPVILLIDDDIEQKFMSSSDGSMQTVIEKKIKLGVSYWMEVHPD